jgi:hypothetical protein
MNEVKENVCRVPVSATMQIIDGEPVMLAAEYAEIPADKIAAFLVEHFGAGEIFGKGGGDDEVN